jgi:ABC-2 type transport system permease protein
MFFRQLRNELIKLFAKKRTYIGFGMFLVAQNAVILLFRFTSATRGMKRILAGNGYDVVEYMSALTLSTMMAIIMAYTLLPLYVALVGGDLVAKEAEDGTLRMILSRPVSRIRLVIVKWLAGLVFSIALVGSLGVFGWIFSAIWFPASGGLFVWLPREVFINDVFMAYDFSEGLAHYTAAHVVMVLKAQTILTLGLMFSSFNMKPAAATVLALSFVTITRILMEIPYFHDLQHWFLAYHLDVWQLLFSKPTPWPRLIESFSVLAAMNFTFLAVGATAFHVRDIKS